MAKLTREQKIEIYQKYQEGHSKVTLSKEYNVRKDNIWYLIKLIDLHGFEVLRDKTNEYYSLTLKEEIINKVLIYGQSASSTAIEYGLTSRGMLFNWIKSYKENNYVIVEKTRGRPPAMTVKKTEKKYEEMSDEEKIKFLENRNEYLEAEIEYRKNEGCGSSQTTARTEEKVSVIQELRPKYKLSLLLRIAKLPKATYFHTINKVNKDTKNEDIINEIKDIYNDHKCRYGYRRITLELLNKGYRVNHKKVKRLMSFEGLYGITPKAKYKSYKGDMHGVMKNQILDKIVDDQNHKTYYERDFTTEGCNEKWATDVSEFHIASGKLYLSPILDMHNGEIISFDISKSPNFKQTQTMLKEAFEKYPRLE